MMRINAKNIEYSQLNAIIKAEREVEIVDCEGQRFIGSGTEGKIIDISGIPGNALGSYMSGSTIVVHGNAQDAVGDTMNGGEIIIHGSVGDAVGYAMRGGEIYILGKAGYRAGIHMKEYKDKKPVIVIGESVGSFLGEYQAGGIIIVLNLKNEDIVGYFCGKGMHGGKIFLRTDKPPEELPEQVKIAKATKNDIAEVEKYLKKFAAYFSESAEKLLSSTYYVLTPNSSNPYKQLYVGN